MDRPRESRRGSPGPPSPRPWDDRTRLLRTASSCLSPSRALPGEESSRPCSQPSDGAGEWTRTTDLLITNQLLYQLSYASLRPAHEGWARIISAADANLPSGLRARADDDVHAVGDRALRQRRQADDADIVGGD